MSRSEQGTIKKALGELAVIVVGVLIALFAESAWSERAERAEAAQYADRLLEESRANLLDLEADLGWAEMVCSSAGAILADTRGDSGEMDGPTLLNHVIAASINRTPALRRATYDDLVATGRFGLIPSAEVRESIVGTYTARDVIERFRPEFEGGYYLNVIEAVPGARMRTFLGCVANSSFTGLNADAAACVLSVPQPDADPILARLVETEYFQRNLAHRENGSCQFRGHLERTLLRHEELVRVLEDGSEW